MRHCNVRVISITNAFPSQGSTSQASEALLWASNVFWNLKAPSVTAVHLDMHYRWVSYMFRVPVTQDNDYMRMVSTYPTIREAREYALCTFSNCVHCIYWSPVWIEYLVSVHNQNTCYVYLAPVYIEYRICVHNQNTWSVYLAPVYIEYRICVHNPNTWSVWIEHLCTLSTCVHWGYECTYSEMCTYSAYILRTPDLCK